MDSNTKDCDDRFVRVTGEAQEMVGLTRRRIVAAAARGEITIYRLKGGGRVGFVRLACLKRLAEEEFEPIGPPTEH